MMITSGKLRKAKQAGHAYVVIDGTLMAIDRVVAGRPFWRILCTLRCCPWRAGQLAKAIHVLQAGR
jgi:hypothetical protein